MSAGSFLWLLSLLRCLLNTGRVFGDVLLLQGYALLLPSVYFFMTGAEGSEPYCPRGDDSDRAKAAGFSFEKAKVAITGVLKMPFVLKTLPVANSQFIQ